MNSGMWLKDSGNSQLEVPTILPWSPRKTKKRVLVPGFAGGLLHETADAVVGVAHNLFFGRERGVGKGVGHYVGRMVADGEQGGHEGMAFGGTLAQHGQGVTEQKGVGYAEMIDDFAARIIFPGIHFVVAVGAEKRRSYCRTGFRGS